MSLAERVVSFPTDRTIIRRVAQAHVRDGKPMQERHFELPADQHAYELAYNQAAMEADTEVAECA